MEKLGKAALISEKNIIKDLDSKYYTTINVKVSKSEDIEKVKEQLKYDYRDDEIQVYSIQELTQELINVNVQLFSILTFFSLAILLIACLGIVNNVIISFIERKKSMAVLRSVGMDSYQLLKMVMIEAVTGGIIAATVGIGCGALMIRITPYLYETTGYKIQADYSLILFVEAIVISIVLMTGASILPGKKAAKLNIIEAIKFE